ncbi:TonB-dependent receptor [Sphingomonas sp. PP-CE-3A-406]|uniref:TonB-dependent receptor n=1 Tax=Sphingomonas sp. PP-CE-3A-406 TaxID=2135659 RepID=UPI000EF8C9F3|nr:TonB-dependent receptor [Sphingomonas sp. PP-CE-3A-406]RMB54931.1 TonB-dependent receptor [Sphingomonas sp. PP-CE-3A-406]
MVGFSFRLLALAGVSSIAIVGPVAAQQTDATSATTTSATGTSAAEPATAPPGDIVVTGIRRANNVAIEAKRNATNIIDVIGSNDVRALPDATIVEALRRIPGLSVLPATDNEHPRDEAATPVIRGLGPAYNNVTIDGLPLASPGTPNGTLGSISRGVRLDILPASMISQLQVVKTFTADLDPNAVGGAINIVTRSAFEGGGKPFVTTEASLGHANDTGLPRHQPDFGTRLGATVSTTFGANHQYGVVLSGNYQTLSSYTDTHMTTDTIHYSFYNAAGQLQTGAGLGNGFAVPQQDKYWYVMDKRDRYGLTGKFEVRPTDTLQAYASLGYYYFKDKMERNEVLIDPRNRGIVQNQTATSGNYPGGDVEVGWENADIVTRTRVAQTGLTWQPGDRQTLSLKGSASRATYDEVFQMIKYATGVARAAPGIAGATPTATSNFAFAYDTSRLDQKFAVDPAAYNNLANYSLLYYRPNNERHASDTVLTGRLDYGFNQGADADGIGFAAGASYTDDRPKFNLDRIDLEPNTTGRPIGLATAVGPGGAPLNYSNGLYLLTIDPAAAVRDITAQPGSILNSTDQSSYNNQDDFRHVEKIAGGYALASYVSSAINAQAGVHLDHTDQSTVGRIKRNGVFVDQPTRSNYTYLLPSAIATWHATHAIDLRAAASQTIGRPSYDSYAARSSIGFVNASDLGNGAATGVNVTIGNPDIKPRRSTNLDLATDWTLSSRYGGIVSLAAFYKDIKDEIFNAASVGYTYEGVNYVNAVVTRPTNASKASIKGIEASAVLNSLEFIHPLLSGFGVSANAALLRGRIDVLSSAGVARSIDRLVGQPDSTLNASVFYAKHGLELRAAYNRQGRALRTIINDIAWQDLYWAPREQVDLTANYTLRNGVAVIGQVSNLTHSRLTSFAGPDKNLLKDSYSVPTTFWLGLRFTPKF